MLYHFITPLSLVARLRSLKKQNRLVGESYLLMRILQQVLVLSAFVTFSSLCVAILWMFYREYVIIYRKLDFIFYVYLKDGRIVHVITSFTLLI